MLQQIGIYILKATCISSMLFLYYQVALRNKQFHFYNRFYLLSAVAVSLVLPLVQLQWFTFFSSSPQTIHLYKIIYGTGEEDVVVKGNYTFNWQQIALYLLAASSIISILQFSARIIKIKKLKYKFPVEKMPEFDFVNTDIDAAPFSFFKNIFWRNDISLQDETGKQILQHEITHVSQKHSWDKVFMQLVLCFFWMNPFYYFIKKELYLIHEFIADEKAVEHSDADAFAKMLLTANFGDFKFLPAQPIFYSSIKRRLLMLTKSKKPGFNYARRLLALPLIATIVCLFAFTIKNKNESSTLPIIKTEKPFLLVVDAGHGGQDFGASGNGLDEKDAVLKIAEKIKSLAPQFGIDVILTRNTDVYMTPKEKSNFANSKNADAFISIHMNAAPENEQALRSGMEVFVSEKNKTLRVENQSLGSSILEKLNSDFKTTGTLLTRNTGIWIMDNSKIPAALIECGYITNTGDANNLKDGAKIELMARNILQGVAAYAGNSNIQPAIYPIQNESDTTVPVELKLLPGKLQVDTSAQIELKLSSPSQPLFIVNGKRLPEEVLKKINVLLIDSITILKGSEAIEKYGSRAKDGAIEVHLKKTDGLQLISTLPPPPLAADTFPANTKEP